MPATKVQPPINPASRMRRIFLKVSIANVAFSAYRKNFLLFAGMAIIIVVSQLYLGSRPIVGVYANAAALVLLVAIALWQESVRKLAIVVSILPIINMLMLSLPISRYSQFTQSVIFYDSLLLIALVYRFMFSLDDPIRATKLKLKGYLMFIPLGIVVGEVLGLVAYGLLRHHYQFRGASDGIVAASVIVFAIVEEVYFRGLIQGQATRVMPPLAAAFLSTAIYGFAIFDHATALTLIYGLIAGAVLSTVYYLKQNILFSVTANALAKLTFVWLLVTFVFR